MIASVFLYLGQLNTPSLEERVVPDQQEVVIESLVRLPKLNAAQYSLLSHTLNNVGYMTQRYGRKDLLRILKVGTQVRTALLPGAMRLGITVNSEDLSGGLSLMQSLLTAPTFLKETYRLKRTPKDFDLVYEPLWILNSAQLTSLATPENSLALWSSIVRTDTVKTVVQGNFKAGESTRIWAMFSDGWLPKFQGTVPFTYASIGKVGSFETKSMVLETPLPSGLSLSDAVICASILGSGKQSILFKHFREKLQISYRQECFIIPTELGWNCRIIIGPQEEEIGDQQLNYVKTELLGAIDKIDEKQLITSQGLIKGFTRGQIPVFPLMLGSQFNIGERVDDQVFFDLYLSQKSNISWKAFKVALDTNCAQIKNLDGVSSKLLFYKNSLNELVRNLVVLNPKK